MVREGTSSGWRSVSGNWVREGIHLQSSGGSAEEGWLGKGSIPREEEGQQKKGGEERGLFSG